MPMETHTFDNADDLLVAARAVLEEHLAAGEVPVLLAPSAAAVARIRRALADGPCALGVRVDTLDSWVADRWELFGDGRRIVGSGERVLLVQKACAEAPREEGCLPPPATPGAVDVLARLAREALPQVLGADAEARRALGDAERGVLRVLERYASLLDERGLCESSQAASALPAHMDAVPPLVVAGLDEVCCAHERLLDELAARACVRRLDDGCRAPAQGAPRTPELQAVLGHLFQPAGDAPVHPTGAVRFLLPAGRYAAPPLILRAVLDALARERNRNPAAGRAALPVAVVARDARGLFDQLAPALAERGVSCAVGARRTFGDTAFGRAFLALAAFAFDGKRPASLASDFALSPFSGLSRRAACELDAAWRADRTVDRARIARDLSAASEAAAQALEAFSRGDADGALAGFEVRLRRRMDFDPAFRAEQLAAVASARRFTADCAAAEASFDGARSLLARLTVPSGARTGAAQGAQNQPEVLFLSLADVAEQPSCSYATLVMCDLDAASYPVRAVEDPATLLLEKLGLDRRCDPLTQTRRRFFRAVATARDALVCERVLNTADADEAYPAVMFEELVDCYRVGCGTPAGSNGVDRATGLPKPLAPFAWTAGEGALHENLALASTHPPLDALPSAEGSWAAWTLPATGAVSPELRERIVVPRAAGGEATCGGAARPVLSPSALESYLECPYKWFALRRLRLSEPDAGFGPLEMGSFSHGVLKSFYERFGESIQAKVRPDDLPRARALLRETFQRHLALQPELSPRHNPLVPRTSFEQAEARDLEKKLLAYLDREAVLLPGFAPAYFEFDFGSAEPFAYAGCWLRGSVDRIDVNERGQAVVIDYKGSLSADYAAASVSPAAQAGGAVLPHKVQALVYAQVARRVLGLEVVGALYVSYGRDGRVSGAFDRTVLGAEELGGIDAEASGVPGAAKEALGVETFAQLVDAVEERIARAVEGLAGGGIGPGPRGADPCGYCPVLSCERRRQA